MYDEHPLAGQDIQYWAADSGSRYTTPFDEHNNTLWIMPGAVFFHLTFDCCHQSLGNRIRIGRVDAPQTQDHGFNPP